MSTELPADRDDLRQQAVTRLRKRRDLHQHFFVYTVMNSVLVVIWLVTMPGGFFWPMFPLALWGMGLVFHAYDVYAAPGPSEERIEREMNRLSRK
ncbi:hypothetical protein Val02_50100 [Virgisporangium aliadipatigenens]|uniref:2TM domain-containing protein n=1 Tax=Virgisporangium aliadipatigenens TaxID=741659 RepID=A0A8J3YMB0_9ACTN|nr:2TM domain-containing protein [Virgisporangium aliadipatigenens]GIJ48124.1 hypothetical protein Val02_50100 [Virgisporangium aliadipatigenens]